ncbi:MAG: radical SAM protein [Deltaproteobacteria bacterium]|nr:radical SAM protein [Deltaproteobacteria bacterium]MBN2672940.1 radical SAM protein [Deltaproteobacteria bacterium]
MDIESKACLSSDTSSAIERIFRHARLHAQAPFGAVFELTRACNLTCPHCYQSSHKSTDELCLSEIEHLLSELAEAGTLFLTLTGGEVFTHKYFWDIVQFAISKHFVVRVKTNGTLLSPRDAKRLKDIGVSELHVSVYHDKPEKHDAFVGLVGAHARALSTLRAFHAHGGHVRAMTLLMNWNLDAVSSLQTLYEAEGWQYTFDCRVEFLEDGKDAPHRFRAENDDIVELVSRLPVLRSTLAQKSEVFNLDWTVCSIGRNSLFIASDGNVYPCAVAKSLMLGNVRNRSIADIWMSSARTRITTITWEQSASCVECEIRLFCRRCPSSAAVEHGDPFQPSSIDCRLAQMRYQAHEQSKKLKKLE